MTISRESNVGQGESNRGRADSLSPGLSRGGGAPAEGPHVYPCLSFQAHEEPLILVGVLTRQAIRRGSFENVRVLTAAIERFTREWNAGAGPFTWVKTADEILAMADRKTQADSAARH